MKWAWAIVAAVPALAAGYYWFSRPVAATVLPGFIRKPFKTFFSPSAGTQGTQVEESDLLIAVYESGLEQRGPLAGVYVWPNWDSSNFPSSWPVQSDLHRVEAYRAANINTPDEAVRLRFRPDGQWAKGGPEQNDYKWTGLPRHLNEGSIVKWKI